MMVTLNVLACNRVGLLPTILKQCRGYFDDIRVLDGSGDGRIRNVCSRLGVYSFDKKWNYNLSESLQSLLDFSEPGEWFFYIADDEIPSQLLLEHIPEIINNCEKSEKYMVYIPFTVRHDGFDSEDPKTYIHQARDIDVYKEFEVANTGNKFRLGRLFKVFADTKFSGDTHEGISGHDYKYEYTEYPIIHIKELDEFYRGNLWTSVINPEGQGLSGESLEKFKIGIADSNITGDQSLIEDMMIDGKLSDSMIQWMDTYSNSINPVEFAWFSVYYFKYHPEYILNCFDLIGDSRFHKWFEVYWHYRDDEFIVQTTLHHDIKVKLMELGFMTVGDYRKNIKECN